MSSYEPNDLVTNVSSDTAVIFDQILENAVIDLEDIDPKLMRRALAQDEGLLLAHINFTLKCYHEEAQNRLNEPDIPIKQKDSEFVPTPSVVSIKQKATCGCRVECNASKWVQNKLEAWLADHPAHTRKDHLLITEFLKWFERQRGDSK